MSYAPGAPEQVWALANVSDGAKLLVLHWWGKADHETQRNPKPCTVWAPAAYDLNGERLTPSESLRVDILRVHPTKAPRTIGGYIAELKSAGLAFVDGRAVELVPPDLAKQRQESANVGEILPESVGENLPPVGENLHRSGEILPTAGENPPTHSYPPDPPTTPHVPAIVASAPANSPGIPDSPHPAKPTPEATACPKCHGAAGGCWTCAPSSPSGARKPRARRPPDHKPGQTALGIPDAPEPDAVAELLEAHRLARIAAGITEPAWPASSSKRWASMRAGCRKAVVERGVEWCRVMLVWRTAEWRRDPGQWAYSTGDVWRPVSLDYAKRHMGGPARASPGTLPMPQSLPDRSLPGFTWTPPT